MLLATGEAPLSLIARGQVEGKRRMGTRAARDSEWREGRKRGAYRFELLFRSRISWTSRGREKGRVWWGHVWWGGAVDQKC